MGQDQLWLVLSLSLDELDERDKEEEETGSEDEKAGNEEDEDEGGGDEDEEEEGCVLLLLVVLLLVLLLVVLDVVDVELEVVEVDEVVGVTMTVEVEVTPPDVIVDTLVVVDCCKLEGKVGVASDLSNDGKSAVSYRRRA